MSCAPSLVVLGSEVRALLRLFCGLVLSAGIVGRAELARGADANPATPAADGDPRPAGGDQEPVQVTVVGQRELQRSKGKNARQVQDMPGAFSDPLRAIEALPGVTPTLSGLPFFFVRGAPPGNTGYLVDGVTVPMLYHFGFGPSILHPWFVRRVDLYSGVYPARYGRYAGAVLVASTTEPTPEPRLHAYARLFDAGAFAEGQLLDQRLSIAVAGRYSYTGGILSLVNPNISLGYWDYQARASYQLTARTALRAFVFGAADFLGEPDDQGNDRTLLDSGFHKVLLTAQHAASSSTALDAGVTLGRERTRTDPRDGFRAVARTVRLHSTVQHRIAPELRLELGSDAELRRFSGKPPDLETDEGEDVEQEIDTSGIASDDEVLEKIFADKTEVNWGGFAELQWNPQYGMRFTLGLRTDVYDSRGKSVVALEPRVASEFDVGQLTLSNGFG